MFPDQSNPFGGLNANDEDDDDADLLEDAPGENFVD
jgi:hypothetical protein